MGDPRTVEGVAAEVDEADFLVARWVRSAGLQTRDNEATRCPPCVDKLLGRQARPCPQVSEVTFHGARPNAYEHGRVLDGSAGGNVGSQDIDLALSRGPRECAPQVPVPHALRAAATGKDSLGVRLIITKRRDC